MDVIQLYFALAIGHFLADYPLQGDFLAQAKNRFHPLPGVPWSEAMSAHTAIHGGMVWLLTGYWYLGLAEMVAHWYIDDRKCASKISFKLDQRLHGYCKVIWAVAAAWLGMPAWLS